MAQMTRGLPSAAAFCLPSHRLVNLGIAAQGDSSGWGLNSLRDRMNWSSGISSIARTGPTHTHTPKAMIVHQDFRSAMIPPSSGTVPQSSNAR
jgi:hypothetical protein